MGGLEWRQPTTCDAPPAARAQSATGRGRPIAEDHADEGIVRAVDARETVVRSFYDQYGRAL
jgi:hypothetical protein